MLRITRTASAMLTIIHLDGKLLGPWVDELRLVVAAVGAKDAVCFNLEHLSFADVDGLDLLRAYTRDGIQLVGASPLIEGLLASRQEPVKTSVVAGVRK